MWLSDTDYQAAQHDRQVRSMTRVMLPMMDVANLVERTPEVERRRAAEHERLAQAIAGHETYASERAPSGTTHLAAWVKAFVASVFRRRQASEAAGRR